MSHQAPAAPRRILRAGQAVLERALDPGVERVEPEQRERLGRAEPAAGGRGGSVVAEHAVRQRKPPLLVEAGGPIGDQSLADHQVAEQPSLLGQPELGSVREFPRAAEVVRDRGGQKQVGVQARM